MGVLLEQDKKMSCSDSPACDRVVAAKTYYWLIACCDITFRKSTAHPLPHRDQRMRTSCLGCHISHRKVRILLEHHGLLRPLNFGYGSGITWAPTCLTSSLSSQKSDSYTHVLHCQQNCTVSKSTQLIKLLNPHNGA